ncbi:hypothetical protein CWC21_01155, partial [Pseudoalteromonas phenolica]
EPDPSYKDVIQHKTFLTRFKVLTQVFNLLFVALATTTKGRLPPVSPWNPTAPFITLDPSNNELI